MKELSLLEKFERKNRENNKKTKEIVLKFIDKEKEKEILSKLKKINN